MLQVISSHTHPLTNRIIKVETTTATTKEEATSVCAPQAITTALTSSMVATKVVRTATTIMAVQIIIIEDRRAKIPITISLNSLRVAEAITTTRVAIAVACQTMAVTQLVMVLTVTTIWIRTEAPPETVM